MGGIISDSSLEYKLPLQFRPCVNRPNMYKSIFDDSYLVHYQKCISKTDFVKQYEHLQFRKCHSDQLLSPKYFNSDAASVCSLNTKIHYFFSTIEYTFAELTSLQNIVEAFTTIIDCLKAADILARKYGYFQIRQAMIFYCEGKPKMWISENPLQSQTQNNINSKRQFVQQVVKMIDSKISKTIFQQYQKILKQSLQSGKNVKQTFGFRNKMARNGFFGSLLNEYLSKDESIENTMYFLFKKLKEIQDASFQKQDQKIQIVSIIDEEDSLAYQRILSNREVILSGQNMANSNVLKIIKQKYSTVDAKLRGSHFRSNSLRQQQQIGIYLAPKLQIEKTKVYPETKYTKPNKFSLKNSSNQNLFKNNFNVQNKNYQSIYKNNSEHCIGEIKIQNKQKNQIQRQDRQTLDYQTRHCETRNEQDRRTIKTNSRKNSDISANMNLNSQPKIQEKRSCRQKIKKTPYSSSTIFKKQLLTKNSQQYDAKQSSKSIQIFNDSIEQGFKETEIQTTQCSTHKNSNTTEILQIKQRKNSNKNSQHIRQQKNYEFDLNLSLKQRFLSQIKQESNCISTSQRGRRSEVVNKIQQNLNSEQFSFSNSFLNRQAQEKQSLVIIKEQPWTKIQILQKSQAQSSNLLYSNPRNENLEFAKNRTSIQLSSFSSKFQKPESQSQQKQNLEFKNLKNLVTNDRAFSNPKKLRKLKKSRFSQVVGSNFQDLTVPNLVKRKVSRQSQQVKALKHFAIIDKQGQDPLFLIQQTELIQLMNNMVKKRSPFRKLTTIESIPGTEEQQYSYIDQEDQYDCQEQQQKDSENSYFN